MGPRRPSPTGPNVVAATVATMGGREGNDRRGQDRRYQKAREGRCERRLDRPGHGVSEPTVRRYLRETDLSERPPAVGRAPESPLLEPFAALVDSWLLEDRRCWYMQRHTAKRVFDRLVAEKGFEGSYSTVRRYVRRRREELARRARRPRGAGGSCCSTGSRASARSTSGRPTSACEASSRAATSSWSRSRTQTSGSRRSSGRDRGVRLPGAPRRLRVPRGRAAAGRVRQRHRGRPQGRRRDEDLGALPPVRRALRARLQLHQPLLVNVNLSFATFANANSPIAPTHFHRSRQRQAPLPASLSGARSLVR